VSANAKLSVAVFMVALALRSITLTFVLPKLRPDVDPDSYRSLGRNLVAGKGFVAMAASGRGLPNVARTPVYPLFLAGLMNVGGDRLGLFLAAQCVLGALTCALTVVIAARWLRPLAAMIAGLLVALDPNSVLRCADLRTETMFTLLVAIAACLMVWRSDRTWGWFASGLLWSLAALTRPIAIWIWVVAMVVAFGQRTSWRDGAWCLAAFLIGFLPLEGVWAARNHALTGHYFISTIGTHNLLLYRAAGVDAELERRKLEDVQQDFHEKYGDIQFVDDPEHLDEALRVYRRVVVKKLFAAPLITIKQAVAGWGKLLFGPGVRALDNALGQAESPAKWWPPVYSMMLVAVVFLGAVGAKRLGREAIVPALLVLYFVALAGGPESNSRFRVPITPMLAVLAVAAMPAARRQP
jgi:hypothetical protein